MTKSTILTKLKSKEKIEQTLLDSRKDNLVRALQVCYESDVDIAWEQIYRVSLNSNFVVISGEVTNVRDVAPPKKDMDEITVGSLINFVLPLMALENEFTPYQLADAIKDTDTIRVIMGDKEFIKFIRGQEVTMDTVKALLPKKSVMDGLKKERGDATSYPNFLSIFNIEELTEQQKASLILNNMAMLRKQ
jgi:hypothetical protein